MGRDRSWEISSPRRLTQRSPPWPQWMCEEQPWALAHAGDNGEEARCQNRQRDAGAKGRAPRHDPSSGDDGCADHNNRPRQAHSYDQRIRRNDCCMTGENQPCRDVHQGEQPSEQGRDCPRSHAARDRHPALDHRSPLRPHSKCESLCRIPRVLVPSHEDDDKDDSNGRADGRANRRTVEDPPPSKADRIAIDQDGREHSRQAAGDGEREDSAPDPSGESTRGCHETVETRPPNHSAAPPLSRPSTDVWGESCMQRTPAREP
ncbi:hypothetical protein BCF74_10533 [Knoellia remsis]|uniref:Uncharacterized protein n=1 Tax=Knoellia remsis TaxID=407159 RepID=A0A2T0UUF4_9MICO|nr:hypothetical protein BCF74_10533 [Knoellia remsis]